MSLTSAVAALLLATQAGSDGPPPTPTTTVAARAVQSPVIDGRDDDEVWRAAVPITEFREFMPTEDKDPRFPTEARVAYDAHNFYVFVRAFDPSPDSILELLARRDIRTPSDQLKIIIDSYFDRRTGYEFAVNPAGVKRDYAIYDDMEEDEAWDGVWEAATQVDSLGWTAEFRIPLSQLRFPTTASNTFGFGVWRDIERYTERVSWPLYRVSRTGLSSQLGQVTGLVGLVAPRRLEIRPYGVTKNVSQPTETGFDHEQQFAAGGDIKYGLTSNLTLDATVNPDFGQVEADPSVLNLSAFETFYEERRPFFLEGVGIFQFPVNCNIVNCRGEALFYSRRIGRAPQLGSLYGDAASPTATTIIGAGKLTGRLAGGLSLGVLEAVTARELGADEGTIEPATNYAVLRAEQDLRHGESGVGFMFTAVNRDLDVWTQDWLRRSAYVAALDFRHRFLGGRYEISGSLDLSRVSGTPTAMALTQTSTVHNYQRPDDSLSFDSTRTVLWGDAEEILFGKVGGGILRFETSYQRRSPGFEINDMGFLQQADQQSWSNWAALQFQKPTSVYQRAYWNFNWWQYWTAEGLPTERAANSNLHAQLNSRWWVHAGATFARLGTVYCDRCARGGPAVRESPAFFSWGGFEGDERDLLVPELWFEYDHYDGGHSEFVAVEPALTLRISSRFSTTAGVSLYRNRDDLQWYANFTDTAGVTHYTFAHLEQETAALVWRLDYTFTPDLTLQVYAQPFISRGTYSNVRELNEPRADAYEDRYRPYDDPAVAADPGGFNAKEFRSNVVLRWEYLPGSTLFVVWTQGRGDYLPDAGDQSLSDEMGDLFRLHPDNTFLIKASYWLSW
jgi:hypothetical protein